MRDDPSNVESIMKTKNADLRASLAKKIFEFETLKEDHEELHRYNTIVKGELNQCKQKLEKIYSRRENLDDSMSIQRPTYDKTSIGFLINMFAKKAEIRSDLKYDDKIESIQSSNKHKEFGQDKEV